MTEKQNREELIAKRNLIFQRLVYNPLEIQLAIEIKGFDDQIAESIERMRVEERKAEQRDKDECSTSEKLHPKL